MPSYDPAPWHQSARGLFRIVAVIATAAGVILILSGLSDFFDAADRVPTGFAPGGAMHGFDHVQPTPPGNPSVMFSGILLTGVGLLCLKRGFMGTATRYALDEVVPEVGPAARYLAGEIRTGMATTVDDSSADRTIPPSPEQRLQQLARLREQGLITADEYARQREAIIRAV